MAKIDELLDSSKVLKYNALKKTTGKYFNSDGDELNIKEPTKDDLLSIISGMYQTIGVMRMEPKRFGINSETYDALENIINLVEEKNVTSETIRWYQKSTKWIFSRSEYNKFLKAKVKFDSAYGKK